MLVYTHTHSCVQPLSVQRSTVQAFPSSQSASEAHGVSDTQVAAPLSGPPWQGISHSASMNVWHPTGHTGSTSTQEKSVHAAFSHSQHVCPRGRNGVGIGMLVAVGSGVPVGGRTHNSPGPPQQFGSPAGERHTQTCSQAPFTQRSTVQPMSSSQSAFVVHPDVAVGLGGGPEHP